MIVEAISLDLVGVGPMLMHSARLADPLDPLTRSIAAITSKRLKTEADQARISELEWQGGLWLHDGQPCLPTHCIKSVLVAGARKRNKGAVARAAFQPDGPALVEHDGPKNIAELWTDIRFRHREMVRVRDALTPRTRPCFPQWRARIAATFLPSMVNRAEVIEFFKLAGPHGLGDHRPEFGRFLVEEVA